MRILAAFFAGFAGAFWIIFEIASVLASVL